MIIQQIKWWTLAEKKPNPDENPDVRINMGAPRDCILCLVAQKNKVVLAAIWMGSCDQFIGIGSDRPLDMEAIDEWCYFPVHPTADILSEYERQLGNS